MTDTLRDRIARIIDPGFDIHEPHLPEWEALGDRLRAAALEKADGILRELGLKWRPISEAPLNEYVLVLIPNAEMPLIYGRLEFEGDPDEPRWYSPEDAVASPLDVEPTHWMPIPPAPEVES